MRSRDPRVKYVISNGRIGTPATDREWRRYCGANPHDHHTHVSVHASHATEVGDWLLAPQAETRTKPKPVEQREAPEVMQLIEVDGTGSIFAVGGGWAHHVQTLTILEEGQRTGLYSSDVRKVSQAFAASIPRADVAIKWLGATQGVAP